jgi:hypothetical protein
MMTIEDQDGRVMRAEMGVDSEGNPALIGIDEDGSRTMFVGVKMVVDPNATHEGTLMMALGTPTPDNPARKLETLTAKSR